MSARAQGRSDTASAKVLEIKFVKIGKLRLVVLRSYTSRLLMAAV